MIYPVSVPRPTITPLKLSYAFCVSFQSDGPLLVWCVELRFVVSFSLRRRWEIKKAGRPHWTKRKTKPPNPRLKPSTRKQPTQNRPPSPRQTQRPGEDRSASVKSITEPQGPRGCQGRLGRLLLLLYVCYISYCLCALLTVR